MTTSNSNPDGSEARLRGIERDVLLASSGELSWLGRRRLRRRLARDPEARRLAETLSLVELATGDEASPPVVSRAPSWRGRVVLAAAAAAVLMLGLHQLGWLSPSTPRGGESRRVVLLPAGKATPTEALHRSSWRLMHASTALDSRPVVGGKLGGRAASYRTAPWPRGRLAGSRGLGTRSPYSTHRFPFRSK